MKGTRRQLPSEQGRFSWWVRGCPRDPGDNGSSGSDSILGSPEPHGDVLGRPTVDPWYRSSERFPSVPASLQPPPADWEWLVLREDATADMTWTPNFQEIRDLQIQRNEMLAVPLAGVLRSILISRCSNMFRDTEALRQLVRRWCPSTHTFFFAHGELTVTLEDVENHWLLPILGDQDPAEIALSPEESKIEAVLADYIGRKNVALGTQAARFNSWMEHFLRIEDPLIRRAAFISYWLSKCVFGEHPAYSIKPLYFCLAVKIAAGVRFPLAPLLLGQLYTQLDLLHAEELAGASCHIVSTAFNSSVVHTFVWEHALEYIRKGKKPYEIRKKFASMPEGVVTNVGDFQGDVPAVFRWVGNKFYDHSLIPSLDSEGKVCWRPYGITHRGFVYESVMSGFRDVEAQDYTLIAGDLTRPQFTIYSAHRVRRQFGFDQEVPAVMGVAAGEIPTINPFFRARAFAYWSSVAPRVIVPNGNRIGVFTAGMANYWRELMAAMVEFKDSGREDISHLLESYTSPLPHPRLFGATNTMTTYANRQSLGYAVWHHEDSRWVIYGNHHPPLWLRDHPHIAAPGKVPSSRGKRNVSAGTPTAVKRKQPDRSKKGEAVSKDSPAQASKRVKTTAGRTRNQSEKLELGRRPSFPPAFPSAPASIAARVAARKSGRGIVYSEKRSKQRADTAARVPVEISEETESESAEATAAEGAESEDVEAAAAAETESEDVEACHLQQRLRVKGTEAAAAEAVSGAGDFTADISSPDIGSLDTDAIINASSEEKDVEAGASIEDDEVSMEEVIEEHVTVGVVTGAERVVEPTPITVTSSGGTVQGLGGEAWCLRILRELPQLQQGYPTPPSPLGESGGTAPTPIITAAVVSAAATVQGDETAPVITEEVPGHAKTFLHTPLKSQEADVTPGSGVPVIEEELAQDPVDDVDMADTHDSYDEAWADAEDNMAGDQAADMEVTAPVAAQISPTRTARSSRGTVNRGRKEDRRLQQWSLPLGADFEVFRVPRGGIRFLKALWEKYGSCSSYFSRGVHVGKFFTDSSYCCVLAHMEHTRLGDITEARDIFSRRVLAELREAEARVAALRDALNAVAPSPWDLASARRASAEARTESALQGLLS
uniref:Aminotransferase-like plant mobile domain-containing protein n=1 Tax=Fagus sylvatica TaxID=28930 RepID=A0A2N9GIL9_FAGSY